MGVKCLAQKAIGTWGIPVMTHIPMKFNLLSLLAAGCILSPAARADDPAILAKARAYLGSESAIAAVKSVHMVGRVSAGNSQDPAKPSSAEVDIIFQVPWQESITVIYPDRILHTVLDNYEAWQQEQAPVSAGQRSIDSNRGSRLTLLSPDQTKVLRADTWENLNFYRGIEGSGGSVRDLGPATTDGVPCEKIAFIHSPTNVYFRYFDQASGRLVYSETLGGARIREQGEIVANGIRFPKSIVTIEKDGRGADATNTYTFDKVTLNENFSASLFDVPLLQPLGAGNSAAPAKP